MRKLRKAQKTALGGVAAALSAVLMLSEGLLPVLMYVMPILTGLIVMFAADIINKKYAFGVFAATSLISMLFSVDKEAALTYITFFGYYPLLKDVYERLPKIAAWLVKLVNFNAATVLTALTAIYIFGIPAEDYGGFGRYSALILLAMANLVFVLYDISLTKNGAKFKYAVRKTVKRIQK